MKVLIVDDQPANLKLLQAQLEGAGHAVISALNGVEALEKLDLGTVDLVISDILMPQMDGYRLCNEIRARPSLGQLPFIFYTATCTSPGDEKLCYDLGADKYLRKPTPARELLAAVEEAVRAPRACSTPALDEGTVLREYSERLVEKLEAKNIELMRSENQLRLIVEHSPAAIAMLDREMRYLVTSRRWILDYRLDGDVLGRSHYDIFPELPERWKEIHRRCLAGAVERCEEDPFPRADGTLDWVRWEIRPWRDAGGDIGGLIVFSEVITQRYVAERERRESERRFREMLGNLDLIAVMLDKRGCVTWCNDHMLRLTGWRDDEVVGKDWFVQFLPQDRQDGRQVFQDLLAGLPSAAHDDHEIVTRAGERRLIHWSNTALRGANGTVIGSASIGEDVTERRRAEELQRRRAEDLETFHQLSVGRELRMIELKREVNECHRRAGLPPPYDLDGMEDTPSHG